MQTIITSPVYNGRIYFTMAAYSPKAQEQLK